MSSKDIGMIVRNVRNNAIDEFLEKIKEHYCKVHPDEMLYTYTVRNFIDTCENLSKDLRTKESIGNELKGEFVKLPIAIGELLYTNRREQGWYFRKQDAPYRVQVEFIGLNNSEDMGGGFFNVTYNDKGCMTQFAFSDIGKEVFFHKEEAEENLKEARELD